MWRYSFQHPQAWEDELSDRAEPVDDGPAPENFSQFLPAGRVEDPRHDARCSSTEQPDRGVNGADRPDHGDIGGQAIDSEQGTGEDEPGGRQAVSDPA